MFVYLKIFRPKMKIFSIFALIIALWQCNYNDYARLYCGQYAPARDGSGI